jgi:hypothetical protein
MAHTGTTIRDAEGAGAAAQNRRLMQALRR